MDPREWRESKGWSQEKLAEELGLADRSAVSRYEKGARDPEAAIKERYFLLSDGQVQPNDFYPLPRWRQRLAEMFEAARAVMSKAA